MDDALFRERIRASLRGKFDQEADKVGLKMSEANPVPGQPAQGTTPQPQGAGANQAGLEKTIHGLLITIGNVIKTNNKLGTGVSIGMKDSDIKKMATEVAKNIVKGDANAFKTSINNSTDTINKKILDFAKKQQAQQQNTTNQPAQQNQNNPQGTAPEGQPGQSGVQPMNAAEAPGHDIQKVEGAIPPQSDWTFREADKPVALGTVKGMAAQMPPQKMADAISKMDPNTYAQFTSGLKKQAFDALGQGGGLGGGEPTSAPSAGGGAKPPTSGASSQGGGDNNAEGNLKLGEL